MAYEKAFVAVDPVICTIRENKLFILLKKREKAPYVGKYELPGGLIQHTETAEDTLRRKLHAFLGKHEFYFEQFHTFTELRRDPRDRAISIGFVALVPAGAVSSPEQWYAYDKLPPLAFDHGEIIRAARVHLLKHADSALVRHFLPALFPLNHLQAAFEVLEGAAYDNRNFRKKMLAAEIVEETKERERGVSHRPAILYRFVS